MRNLKIVSMVITLFGLIVWCALFMDSRPQNCTIFTVEVGDTVLYGNNEDWHAGDLIAGFYPGNDGEFGAVHLGYRDRSGRLMYNGALNDQGLVWDVNSVPKSNLAPHPERIYSYAEDGYLSTITSHAATVEEAIALSKQFDFDDQMKIQIHIADAQGKAVVISAGPDGELAYTRRKSGDGYLISTNFNLADSSKGSPGWRYETAAEKLEEILLSGSVSLSDAGKVLEAVKLNNLTTYTLYSNVMDLKTRQVGVFYKSQFDEMAVIDLKEELAKGKRVESMSTFFSEQTVALGDAAYKRFEWRFRIFQAGTILIFLTFGGMLTVKAVKWFGKREKQQRGL